MDKNEKKNTIPHSKLIIISLLIIALFTLERFLLNGITKVEGVKIGLYNMFIVFVIVNTKKRYAFILLFVKLFAAIFIVDQVIFYPLLGGILSIIVMLMCDYKFRNKIGYAGISIIGALVYNISIYILATISLQSTAVLYNIPQVLLLSVIYGTITGSFAFAIKKTDILRLGYGEKNE